MPDMDVPYCTSQIRKAIIEMNSPYNDGYLAWGIKQDLYLLKFMLDNVLANAPTFVGEEEWLKEQSQAKMVEILKK